MRKKLVGLEFPKPVDCSPGEQKWMNVQIGYTREGGFDPPGVSKEGVQIGTKKIRVDCMNTTYVEPTTFHFNGNYLLPPLVPGQEYEYVFQTSNGVEPYAYSTLDYLYGLKFDLSGRLYGMPMPFEDLPYEIFITVKASDANGSRVERVYRLPVEGKTAPLPPMPANETENISNVNATVPEETLPKATPLQ